MITLTHIPTSAQKKKYLCSKKKKNPFTHELEELLEKKKLQKFGGIETEFVYKNKHRPQSLY